MLTWYRRYNLLVLIFALVFPVTAFAAAPTTLNKIAAVVNGEMITLHDLRMHSAAEMARRNIKAGSPEEAKIRKDILDSLINDILIRHEAKRYSVTVPDSEAEAEVGKFIAQSGMTSAQFEQGLKKQGITRRMFTERMRNNMLRMRMTNFMIDRKVFVTSEQIADYFKKNPQEFAGEKNADFSLMVIPGTQDIQAIYRQLSSGKISFEDAAKQYSSDDSAKNGGKISNVPWARLPGDMQKLLNSLKDRGMSPPLRTQGGFVIIRRDSINPPKPLTLQEASPRIEEKLLAPLREERFKEYIKQLREKAVLDIRL